MSVYINVFHIISISVHFRVRKLEYRNIQRHRW